MTLGISYLTPFTSSIQSTERISQGATGGGSQRQRYASFTCYAYWPVSKNGPCNSPRTTSIHILDDDSLLRVFYLYQPFLLGENQDDRAHLVGGWGSWVQGRWWYTLAHVCQRWRNLMLGSASYLGVSLVCTDGTPVADMLAHSPPLPLTIDYDGGAAEDEEGAILALKQRERVRRVRLWMSATELIGAMDEEYPILEYLIIGRPEDRTTILKLPETLQAPHLHHLTLEGFALPSRSRLLMNAVGLVSLCLVMNDPSTYFHPNTLVLWLSFMPQLETLVITLYFPVPNREIERQPTHTPITPPVTLLDLHLLRFSGVSAYLEALVDRIITPRLERLEIGFSIQLMFSIPRLLQFLDTTENLRFDSAKFWFHEKRVYLRVYPRRELREIGIPALAIDIDCLHLDWQVSSVAQIVNSPSQIFSAVEHLTFKHKVHYLSSEEHNQVDRTEWRKLLGSFRNVKTIRIDNGLVEQFSHCLVLDDGELPLELLPELQDLTYSGSDNTGDVFTSFINARQNAGRPVTQALVPYWDV